MNDTKNSQELYFYADREAVIYDEIVALSDPSYYQLHDALKKQVLAWIKANNLDDTTKNIQVLDIGCGTGIEAIGLLQGHPSIHLTGVDISEFMLEQFRLKLAKVFNDETASGRCRLVQADIQKKECIEDIVTNQQGNSSLSTFHIVLSAYTLHHFSKNTKALIYNEIYRHLRPGGVFINADLFSYQTPWLRDQVQQELERWIEDQFNLASKRLGKYSIKDPSTWGHLRDQWLYHIREENNPLPALTNQISPGSESSIVSEQSLLLDAGFNQIEYTFRQGQTGIIGAFNLE